MKKSKIALLLCGIILSGLNPHFANATVKIEEAPPSTADTTFESKEKNFSITYPSTWKKKEIPKLDLVLFAPLKAAAKEPQASMNVVSEKVEPGVLLDLLYNDSIENLSKALQQVKIIKSGDIKLSGIPAKWVRYTHVMQDNKFEVLQYFMVVKDTVYLVTFSAKAEAFEEFQPVFERVVASFKLLTEPAKA